MFLTCQVKSISVEAGLPNITGSPNCTMGNASTGGSGALYTIVIAGSATFVEGAAPGVLSFNASLSNPTYGNSDTVTPTSQSTLYILKY